MRAVALILGGLLIGGAIFGATVYGLGNDRRVIWLFVGGALLLAAGMA